MEPYEPGATVTLTATPPAERVVRGLVRRLRGDGRLRRRDADGDRSVTATFGPHAVFQFSAPSYTVSV